MNVNEFTQVVIDQRKELTFIASEHLCARKEEERFEIGSSLAQIVIGVRRTSAAY
ncbi:MAG: hypothetical protein LBN29_03840 [Mediterranea sp.]|nr:hypothetical protein [Mediterranea sp.]